MSDADKPAAPPPPGSDAAIALGCCCPILDNAHGAGRVIDGCAQYWIIENCPLHWRKKGFEDDARGT